jgi:hypothetical protein
MPADAMTSFNLEIVANFWPINAALPTIEEHYGKLWQFAKALQAIGIPLDEWYPPADTPVNSLLNNAFGESGPTPAALAMAHADKANRATDLRSLGAWNGVDEEGGMAFTTMLKTSIRPSTFEFSAKGSEPLKDVSNVLKVVQTVLDIWSPVMVLVGPYGYEDRKVFKDRPPVSWMVYLPFTIETCNAPEASALIPVFDSDKTQKGTIVISVTEMFDPDNQEHVQRANDLEIRLADQDLLPRFMEFMKFRPSND